MKKFLLPLLCLCTINYGYAQHDVYALTGKSSTHVMFNDFRAVDLRSGSSGTIFMNADQVQKVHSQVLNTDVSESRQSVHHAQSPAMATLAYSGHNLFFSPMFSPNIYVLNTQNKKITLVENNAIQTSACQVASHITRMTAGADGHVYAIDNGASQLIRISEENGKYTVTNMGKIHDRSTDPGQSLQTPAAGYGGDMVADAAGNLYILAASGNVFSVSPKTMSASFLGSITGLPEGYSLNGAAVTADGNIVVASAKGQGFYEVDFATLRAKPLNNGLNLNIYDLASKYFLNDLNKNVTTDFAGVKVYPTKVKDGEVFIRTSDDKMKLFFVELFDASGVKVLSQSANIQRSGTASVSVHNLKTGLYILNVSNEKGDRLSSAKIIIE